MQIPAAPVVRGHRELPVAEARVKIGKQLRGI